MGTQATAQAVAGGQEPGGQRPGIKIFKGGEGGKGGASQLFHGRVAVGVHPGFHLPDDPGDGVIALLLDHGCQLHRVGAQHEKFQGALAAEDAADAANLHLGALQKGGRGGQGDGMDGQAGVAPIGGHTGLAPSQVDAIEALDGVDGANGVGAGVFHSPQIIGVLSRFIGELHHDRDVRGLNGGLDQRVAVFGAGTQPLVSGAHRGGNADLQGIRSQPFRPGGQIGQLRGGGGPDAEDELAVLFLQLLHFRFPLLQLQIGIQLGIEHTLAFQVDPGADVAVGFQGKGLGNHRRSPGVDTALEGGAVPGPGTCGHQNGIL